MSVFEKYDSKKGFTLIEILVSLAIAGIVMAAAYSLYITFYKQTAAQDLLVEAQQNARAGIELMQKELALVGHRVPSTVNPIQTAASNSIEFRYIDPNAIAAEQNLKITYYVEEIDGVYVLLRQKCVQDANWTGCIDITPSRVVEYLNGANALNISYYDAGGLATATLANIRFAKVSLTTVTKTVLPTTRTTRTVEVRTEVRLRNLGILSSAADTTPPGQPTGLKVREVSIGGRVGFCGRLRLKWTKGTDVDLAGYRIFYSTGSGANVIGWSATVSLGSLESDATSYYYTLAPTAAVGSGGLDFCPSDGSAVTTYTFTIRAYDNHSNFSTASDPPVSGNPTPSNGDFSVAGDDTTINPSKPTAVTGFTGQDGPADGQVMLAWNYNRANNPDVIGFRIYRSTAPFTVFPIVPGGIITQIAAAPNEGFPANRTLSDDDTFFTDSDVNLVGCQVFYYAIAPVTCDTTLIGATDAVENGDNTRYIAGDYAFTWGDGAGIEADSPAGSDTSPPDNTGIGQGIAGYPYPELAARPGWKRVKLDLTNPRTTGAAPVDPDFSHTFIAFKKFPSNFGCGAACWPTNISVNGTVADGTRVQDRNITDGTADISGKFTLTGSGGGNSFWFDSETQISAAPPQLDNECPVGSGIPCTYYFTAIAFDRCGNPGAVTAFAQPLSILCGDDPEALGAPAAPSGLAIAGCANPVQFSWGDQSALIDFAGYTVYRNTSDSLEGATNITGTTNYTAASPYPDSYWPDNAACPWGCGKPYKEDSGVVEGESYYYLVRAMDCAYANDPLDNVINFSANISSAASIGPITPGRIGRDEKCPDGGSCDKDLHREVLSGITINATNSSTPSTSFTHNTVTMFIENTSAGNMSIQGASVRWVNSSAYLRNITIGGGRTGLPVISNDLPQSATTDVIDDPYTKRVSDYDFATDATITGLKRYVPITFEFRDSIGGNSVNMREDELKITLNVMNDSTGTTTCVSYVTISESSEGIVVPRGPVINSVQQTNPSSSAYPVPGPEGTNILPITGGTAYGPLVADSTTNVSVSAYAVKGGDIPISSVKLYWARTDITDGDARDGSPSAASFTANETTMTNTSGNLWSGTILADAITPLPARIWYYVVTIDNDGNYDRSPEINEGYYTFDMKPIDPCEVTPSTPAQLGAAFATTNSEVSIRWPKVTTYTNGSAIGASDAIVYQVWRKHALSGVGSDFIKIYETDPATIAECGWQAATATAPATESNQTYTSCLTEPTIYYYWMDKIDTVSNDITYYVVAKNSCADPAKGISGNSNTYHECRGGGATTLSVTPSTLKADSGLDFTVNASVCADAINGTANVLNNVNITTGMGLDTDIVSIKETGDTGTYIYQMKPTNDSATNTSRDWSCPSSADCWGYVLTDSRDTVDPSDTVTVSVAGATPASVTVNVALDACYKDPSAPTGLIGVKGPTTGAAAGRNRYVDLSWSASASVDRAKYRIYRKIGSGAFEAVAEYVSTASGTITFQHEPGKAELDANDYYYYVTTVDSCATAPYASGRESVPSNTVGPY